MKSKLLLLITFIASFLTFTSSNVSALPYCQPLNSSYPIPSLYHSQGIKNIYSYYFTNTYYDLSYPSICQTNNFSYLEIEDNFNTSNQSSSIFSLYYNNTVSNCWRIRGIWQGGYSSWSEKICYTYIPPTTTISPTTTTIPRQKCLPWKDKLVLYPELANVTNNGYYFRQYQANCDYGQLLYSQVKSKYSTKRISPSNQGGFDKYFNRTKSNCWRIRHVTTNGVSPWSNRVCYNHKKYKAYWLYPASPYWPPIGSICSDGWLSPSVGSGTCSWHGGIAK
jgi:hypothetical protein